MRASTSIEAMQPNPTFPGLARFFAKLLLGKKTYILFALFVMILLSGHLSFPQAIANYNQDKQREAQDINGIAMAFLESYQSPENISEHAFDQRTQQNINESVSFWSDLQTQSSILFQTYHVMMRYHKEQPSGLGKEWHAIYNKVLEGVKEGFLTKDADVLLRIGQVQLIEDSIYNNARKEMGMQPEQLRPAFSRAQYWRNILSGSHVFSILPLLMMVLLLHNSFSVDHESGSAKLINSLPVSNFKLNAARLLGQGLLAMALLMIGIILCSLTYPVVHESGYLWKHGQFLDLESYMTQHISYADYLLTEKAYFLRSGSLYLLMILLCGSFTMLLSNRVKNSILALLLPTTLLLFCFMPNHMRTSLGDVAPRLTALLSPQMVLENKAALSFSTLSGLFLICELVFILTILFSGHSNRRRHVD